MSNSKPLNIKTCDFISSDFRLSAAEKAGIARAKKKAKKLRHDMLLIHHTENEFKRTKLRQYERDFKALRMSDSTFCDIDAFSNVEQVDIPKVSEAKSETARSRRRQKRAEVLQVEMEGLMPDRGIFECFKEMKAQFMVQLGKNVASSALKIAKMSFDVILAIYQIMRVRDMIDIYYIVSNLFSHLNISNFLSDFLYGYLGETLALSVVRLREKMKTSSFKGVFQGKPSSSKRVEVVYSGDKKDLPNPYGDFDMYPIHNPSKYEKYFPTGVPTRDSSPSGDENEVEAKMEGLSDTFNSFSSNIHWFLDSEIVQVIKNLLSVCIGFGVLPLGMAKEATKFIGRGISNIGDRAYPELMAIYFKNTAALLGWYESWKKGASIESLFAGNPLDSAMLSALKLLKQQDLIFTGAPPVGGTGISITDWYNEAIRTIAIIDNHTKKSGNKSPRIKEIITAQCELQVAINAAKTRMAAETRIPPIGIFIYGDPGSGKSHLINFAAAVCCEVYGTEYHDGVIFHRNNASDYMEALQPLSHRIFHYSEAGKFTNKVMLTREDKVMNEWLSVMDSQPMEANKAFAAKGKEFINPYCLIMDSNNSDPFDPALWTAPAALNRRLLYVKVEPLKKKVIEGKWTSEIDSEALADRDIFDRFKFTITKKFSQGNVHHLTKKLHSSDTVDIDGFYDILKEVFTKQLNLNTGLRDQAQRKLKTMHYGTEKRHLRSLPIIIPDDSETRDENVAYDDGLPEDHELDLDSKEDLVKAEGDSGSLTKIFDKIFRKNANEIVVGPEYEEPEDEFPQRSLTIREDLRARAWCLRNWGLTFVGQTRCNFEIAKLYLETERRKKSMWSRTDVSGYYPWLFVSHFLGYSTISYLLFAILLFIHFFGVAFQLWLDVPTYSEKYEKLLREKEYYVECRKAINGKLSDPLVMVSSAKGYAQAKPIAGLVAGATVFSLAAFCLYKMLKTKAPENIQMEGNVNSTASTDVSIDTFSGGGCNIKIPINRVINGYNVMVSNPRLAFTGDFNSFIKLVYHNVRKITTYDFDTGALIICVHALGIKNNIFLTVSHAFPKKIAKIRVDFMFSEKREHDQVLYSCAVDWNDIVQVSEETVAFCAHSVARVRDITAHFPEVPFVPTPSTNVLMPKTIENGTIDMHTTTLSKREGKVAYIDTQGDKCTVVNSYEYDWPEHKQGLCGLPLIVQQGKEFCVAGVHFSVASKSNKCFGTIISKFDLNKLDKHNFSLILANSEGEIPETTFVSRNSVFRYEVCHVPILGKLTGALACPWKTSKLTRTPFPVESVDKIFRRLGKSEFAELGPPILEPIGRGTDDYYSPWNEMVKKMNHTKPCIDPTIRSKAINKFTSHIILGLESKGITQLRPYGWKQAVNGDPNNPNFRRINVRTSPGFGRKGDKSLYLPVLDMNDPVYGLLRGIEPKLYRELNEIVRGYVVLVSAEPITEVALKDEARKVGKPARPFYVQNLPMVILSRMFLGPILVLMISFGEIFGSAVGIDYRVEAGKIFRLFKDFSNHYGDSDISNFDLAMPGEIVLMVNTVIYNVAKHFGYSETELLILQGVLSDVSYGNLSILKEVVRVCMDLSGRYGTAELNCLMNKMLLFVYWLSHPNLKDLDFFSNLLTATYGDDIMWAIKDELAQDFDNVQLAMFYKEKLNMTITAAVKGAELKPFTDIWDLSFLKREFFYHSEVKDIVGRLDYNSIRKTLLWYLPSEAVTPLEQVASALESVLYELYFYDPDTFDANRKDVLELFNTYYKDEPKFLRFFNKLPDRTKILSSVKANEMMMMAEKSSLPTCDVVEIEGYVGVPFGRGTFQRSHQWSQRGVLNEEKEVVYSPLNPHPFWSADSQASSYTYREVIRCPTFVSAVVDEIDYLERVLESCPVLGIDLTPSKIWRTRRTAAYQGDGEYRARFEKLVKLVDRRDSVIHTLRSLKNFDFNTRVDPEGLVTAYDDHWNPILFTRLRHRDIQLISQTRICEDIMQVVDDSLEESEVASTLESMSSTEDVFMEGDVGLIESETFTDEEVKVYENVTELMGAPPTASDSTRGSTMNLQRADATLAEFFSRKILNSKVSLALSTESFQVINVWENLFGAPSMRRKFSNFMSMKCTLVLTIDGTADPFVQSRILFSYHPFSNSANEVANGYSSNTTYNTTSYKNHLLCYMSQQKITAWMDFKKNSSAVLRIPMFFPASFARLFNPGTTTSLGAASNIWDFQFGQLFMLTAVAPVSTSAGGTSPYFVIQSHLEDVELGLPTGSQMVITTEGDDEPVGERVVFETLANMEGDERVVGPIERISTGAAQISGALEKVPYLSPYAMASKLFFSGISKLAALFGFSYPNLVTRPMRMKNEPYQNGAQFIGSDTGKYISWDPLMEVSIDPFILGQDKDEMNFSEIYNRWSYLTQFTWSPSDVPLTPKYQIAVSPMVSPIVANPYGGAHVIIQPTALSYLSLPFTYWWGELVYELEFVKPFQARGIFLIGYEYNVSQEVNINTNMDLDKNQIVEVNIQDVDRISICVPWNHHLPWMRNAKKSDVGNLMGATLTSPANYAELCNGYLWFAPLTELQTSDGSSIQVLVKIKAKRMRYALPDNTRMPNIFSPWTLFEDKKEDEEDYVVHAEGSREEVNKPGEFGTDMCINMFENHADNTHNAEITIGENLTSFRQILKRFWYSANATCSSAANTAGVATFTAPIIPTANPGFPSTGGASVEMDWFSYLRFAFAGCRGSFRKRVRILGTNNNDYQSATKVRLSSVANTQPSATVSLGAAPAYSRSIGTVTFLPAIQSGIEFQIGQYMPNHFYTTAKNSDVLTNSLTAWTDPYAVRGYVVDSEYSNTTGYTNNINAQEETACGDDFSFGFFIGGVPYDQ